jgi:hypothetical protein
MTANAQPEKSQLAAALGEGFQRGWRRLAADDQHEPMLERLAACAEGRLSAGEEASVAREISESPAALEILASLLADEAQARPLPSVETTAPAVAGTVVRPAAAVEQPRRHSQLAVWAMAASLLVAAWGLVRSRGLQNDVAMLSDRAHEATRQLVLSERERLASLPGNGTNSYLLDATSPELAQSTIAAFGASLAGDNRGADDLTDEQAADLERAQERLAAAAAQFDQTTLAGQLEYAAALAAAGRSEDAAKLLDRIEASARGAAVTQSRWENLRAGVYALEAAEAPVAQSAPLWEKAELLFRSAADHGLNDAWLNLAVMLAERGNTAEAVAAAQKYLAGETDPKRRELVNKAISQ